MFLIQWSAQKVLMAMAAISMALAAMSTPALAKLPVEAFGALPDIEDVALSPDGKHVAFLMRRNGKTMMLVRELGNAKAPANGLDASNIKPRSVTWANNHFVLLYASRTLNNRVFTASKIEFGAVFSYDIDNGRVRQMLTHTKDLGLNSSLGQIDGILPDEETLLMPAFTGQPETRQKVLFKVSLKTGIGHIQTKGSGMDTLEFITNSVGKVRARVDYSGKSGMFRINGKDGARWYRVYQEKSSLTPMGVAGLSADQKSLIITDHRGRDTRGLYAMDLASGKIEGPVLWHKGADLVKTLSSPDDNIVFGAVFASLEGDDYQFLDAEMARTWAAIKKAMGGAVVIPVDWTKDKSRWLLYAEGGNSAGLYLLYNAADGTLQALASRRPQIKPEDIADVLTIHYKSRDGTTIPALLTLPPGYQKHRAALVVLPHGGPSGHDSLGWDWMAQFLANEGYLVLQPNFRGSDGFGADFENAGDGQWNGLVLDDISAGVTGMIKAGYADPGRICIVGASFGGYAALAGLVFTPDIYACAVAIAPLADSKDFLKFKKATLGAQSFAVSYWQLAMGGPDGKSDLDAISPAKHADAAKAPLLLIHGRDDTVVPIAQSFTMKRAMARAHKSVQLVTLKGEDHWLSTAKTRTETLQAMQEFLHKYLGSSAANSPGSGPLAGPP